MPEGASGTTGQPLLLGVNIWPFFISSVVGGLASCSSPSWVSFSHFSFSLKTHFLFASDRMVPLSRDFKPSSYGGTSPLSPKGTCFVFSLLSLIGCRTRTPLLVFSEKCPRFRSPLTTVRFLLHLFRFVQYQCLSFLPGLVSLSLVPQKLSSLNLSRSHFLINAVITPSFLWAPLWWHPVGFNRCCSHFHSFFNSL